MTGPDTSELAFSVRDVVAEPYSAAPQLTARVRIEDGSGERIHAIVLRCQVRIEPQRRPYDQAEQEGLRGLFGGRERWSDTLRPFLWMQCNTTVQGFTGTTEVDLALPCTYDFDVVGSRYLHALGAGTVPVSLLFSGTVFTKGTGDGGSGFGVRQVPWDCEARYELPVAVWRQVIDFHFPRSGWIRLEHDVLSSFAEFRERHGLISWDETVRTLLAGAAGADADELDEVVR
ncbi:DUF6084 family protein [Streptomyces griseoviridis]|uniref:Uncharacterized protein n=2 Tax=Streptomyces TaxID=1883 RepID=A0A3S9Z6S8_STRGD|nr:MULTISPECIES: DUF6084 family protein [Streptomyces]AZS83458.1 hypothetical protein ELQ87_03505 [Streptomyces griseoviridis]MDH6696249.1 hypothetical protein [Streptomyces sp. MAA16]MDT0473595.1 DUF6084 family protein [Streptomyces sp. DSM 41014]QCN89688.1 hypothetical protein DDJ31_35850 [Streptomyces griseoviridis]